MSRVSSKNAWLKRPEKNGGSHPRTQILKHPAGEQKHFAFPAQSRRRMSGRRNIFEPSARKRLPGDRKSTRLNSSHSQISYAVFCLKKKKKKKHRHKLTCQT